MTKKFLSLVLMFMAVSLNAIAQSPNLPLEKRFSAKQMQATGLDTLSSAQLLLLNQLLQEQTPQTSAATLQQNSAPIIASPAINTSATLTPTATPILSNEPFKSRIIGNVAAWQTGTLFTLENGQQWQVNKGSAKLLNSLKDPIVNVNISLVGKWFFQFDDEDLPRAMVTRIK